MSAFPCSGLLPARRRRAFPRFWRPCYTRVKHAVFAVLRQCKGSGNQEKRGGAFMLLRLMGILIAAGGAFIVQAQHQARGQTPPASLVVNEEMIASEAPGLRLYVRN